jgi:hypothetical protein
MTLPSTRATRAWDGAAGHERCAELPAALDHPERVRPGRREVLVVEDRADLATGELLVGVVFFVCAVYTITP